MIYQKIKQKKQELKLIKDYINIWGKLFKMKKLFLFLFLITNLVMADELDSDFYEPNISNAYQGRLMYDLLEEDYPIDKMIKLCAPFTGIDTAQTKCKKQSQQSIMVCEYKCSLHWSTF